jgi:pheromone shutdown protein TraB
MMSPLLILLLLLSTFSLAGSSTSQQSSTVLQKWGLPPATSTNNSTLVSNFTNSCVIPAWKQRLPVELQNRATLQRIVIPTAPGYYTTVYLLGTSHVSNDSSADVNLLLYSVRPNVVFLELCQQRIGMLDSSNHAENELDTRSTNNNNNNMTFWQKVRLVQQQSQGMTRAGALGTVLLTSVQQDYAESLGVELGSEFQRAHEYCLHNHVPRSTICILGDRPLQITLLRAWESLRWWGKTRVVLGLVWNLLKRQDAQELREWMQTILVQEGETDVLTTSIQELKRHFPTLERVILQERDAYMACKIYQSCRALPRRENHTMVAIVGAGHVRGMVRWLTVPSNQTPEEILSPLVTTRTGSFDEVQTLITDVTQLTIRHE